MLPARTGWAAGETCVSCATDPSFFDGSPASLRQIETSSSGSSGFSRYSSQP